MQQNSIASEPYLFELEPEAKQLYDILNPMVADEGLELIHLQLSGGDKGKKLTLFVDEPEASKRVELTRISELSLFLGHCLDVEDGDKNLFEGKYTLEVSSPGIERPLTKLPHFNDVIGKKVLLKGAPHESLPKKMTTTLNAVKPEGLDVTNDSGEALSIAWDQLKGANLIFEFPKKTKKGAR